MTESPQNVDAVSPTPPVPQPQMVPPHVRMRAVRAIFVCALIPYFAYLAWCLYVLSVLPNIAGTHQNLIPLTFASSGMVLLLIVGMMATTSRHALKDRTATRYGKANAIGRITLFLTPAFLLSLATPVMIVREPALPLDIVKFSPEDGVDLVAPVAITFSVDRALAVLARKGLQPISYFWDLDGDGKTNEETLDPQITAYFGRSGAYGVSVDITLVDGSARRVARRVVIPKAVYSVDPVEPIVDQPVTFSVENLVADTEMIHEVRWDFDDDGKVDEIRTDSKVTHIFSRTGVHRVSAVVLQENQTQQTFRRDIEVRDPPPQPFDILLVSEPKKLLSPPPFGTIFTLTTDEPLREVEWDFADKSPIVKTVDQHRVGHTFDVIGSFRVTARARSKTGDTAEASALVQIVEILRIPDLTFDGFPAVVGNKITGEAPLSISITPNTTLPLIDFSWEAPGATSVGSAENALQAIYRYPGTYRLTLLGSDPEGKAMRLPIAVEVKPPSSVVTFQMDKKSGVAPFKVRFDASQTVIPGKTISGFEWIFGDQSTGITRKQGIAIEENTFEKPGKYPVKLIVYTTTDETYESSSTVVVLPPRLDACFIPSRKVGKMGGKPFGVSFDRSCSSGYLEKIVWDFDDGSQSDDLATRVVHVFEQPGVYDVTLTVQDSTGARSTTSQQISIEP